MDWKLHLPGAHFQAPGLLGLSPPGKPLSFRTDTDTLSQLLTPGPIGHNPWNEDVAREAFIRALLTAQIDDRENRGSKQILELPEGQRGRIADGLWMHKDVAPLFNKMWDEIREAFKKRTGAAKGDSIGIASAYRSADKDNQKWYGVLPKYLRATRVKRIATGEAFGYGPKSMEIVFRHMNGKKAPAGYSGHTHGIAADLKTTHNGHSYTANTDVVHQKGWQGTWLYQWLVENAGRHKFYQLKTETFHWEYHSGKIPTTVWGADVEIGKRVVKT